jgi:FHA domain
MWARISDTVAMSFYIKFKDKSFKVPNTIMVGRGEPFTIFGRDDLVSRVHFKAEYKKYKFYITAMDKQRPTVVNNKVLKKGRPTEIKATDVVKVGSFECTLCLLPPAGEIIEVKLNSYEPAPVLTYAIIATGLISAIVHARPVFSNPESFDYLAALPKFFKWWVAQAVFFWAISPALVGARIVNILFGRDGFTLHFKNGKNMTIKKAEVKSWKLSFGMLSIDTARGSYSFYVPKEFGPFKNYLQKEYRDRHPRFFKHWLKPKNLVALGCVLLAILAYGYELKHVKAEKRDPAAVERP